jgi:hypothetical protein
VKTKHTPGPWRYDPYEGSYQSAIIGECYQIATVSYDDWDHSNAAFIVRAVNAHDDLLAACKAALSLTENRGNLQFMECTATLRAAIAKAEGGAA